MKTFRPQQTNQYHFRLIAILVVGVVMVSSSVIHIASAQVMSSGSYSIQADSVNFGGTRSSSGSYALEDTGGEVGTGDLQGTTNILHAGYQQSAAAAAPSTSTSSATQTVPSTSSGGGRLPLNVLNFAATPGTTSIFLSWEYPTGSGIQSVRIVRSTTFFPTSLSDGDVIFEGDAQSVIDHNVVKGTRYYYTLFARNTAGFYSSGVLAQAQLLSAGEAVVQPPSNPFEQIPDATDVHPVIANLTLLDFDFIQEGKKIAHAGNTVVIDGTKNLTVQLAYDKVPQLLKTIAISLADPQDETRIFTFLLRVNADQTAYEATIAPLTKSGNYRLHAIVLDYKNQGLKRLQGNLRAVVFEGVAGLLERGGMPAIWLWIVVALIVMMGIVMLARRVRRNRRGPGAAGSGGASPSASGGTVPSASGTSVPIYKKILSLIIIGTMVFVSSGLFASPAHAAINKQINYQGKLADSAGDAVADGTYAMHFNLYTTSSGGSTLWTEDRTGANEVQVTDGLFSVMLGSVTSLASVDFNQTLYLGVAIESDSEMTPRKIIGAVPSAFVADTLDGLDSTQFLRADTGSASIGYFVATSTTASVFPNASTTNITIAGKLFDSTGSGGINGQVLKVSGGVPVWGTDNSGSGGGSEINWTYFNGSGVYVSTTTNQVLIGDIATTSNQKLEVIGGAYISGNLGLGTTSPYAKLSVDGRGVFNQDVRANYFTATSTTASTFPYASTTALTVSGTASTTNLVVSGAATTTNLAVTSVISSLLKTNSLGQLTAAVAGTDYSNFSYLFPSNATSTLLSFTGGLISSASTTIGNGTQTGGLTISGGATTTGNQYVAGTLTSAGQILAPNGTVGAPGFAFTSAPDNGFRYNPAFVIETVTNGATALSVGPSEVLLPAVSSLGWGSSGVSSADTFLSRDAANTLALKNSTNAQTLNVYGTFTNTSNYERLSINLNSTSIDFTSGAAGSGTARPFNFTGANLGIGTSSPYAKLSVDGRGVFNQDVRANYFTATSTSVASTFPYASTTALTVSGTASTTNLVVSSSATIGTLNGPLHANAGLISATTSIGVLYGGTGLTSIASSSLLIGGPNNTFIGFATSSLGIALSDTTGTLAVSRGGTGLSSYTLGDVLYANGTGSLAGTSTANLKTTLALNNVENTALSTWAGSTNLTTLGTIGTGLWHGTAIEDAYLTKSGNWTGTFDGQEGSYYLDARNLTNFGTPFYTFFSATTTDALTEGVSRLYWTNDRFDARLAATTTLPNLTTLLGLTDIIATRATTTNATTTALYISGTVRGAGLTSCSSAADKLTWNSTTGQFGCGTDASGSGSGGGSWSTTTSTVAGEFVNYSNNTTDIVTIGGTSTSTARYWFDPNISTSYLAGNVGIGSTSPSWRLSVSGIGSFDDYVRASYFTATSTSIASTFPYASTTALTVSGTNGLQLATGLNGPLQANAGLVSATTSIGVLYGGTGLTSSPSYGNILVGNASGGYTLTATSSLGLPTFSYLFPSNATSTLLSFTGGLTSYASTTIGDGTQTGGLTISGGATTTGNAYVAGNLGIGTVSPSTKLHVAGSATLDANLSLDESITIGNLVKIARFNGDDATYNDIGFYGPPSTLLMTILNTGNVGIGTSSPYAKLSVDGRGVFNQDVRANYFTATSTSIASTFPYASTTALTVSGTASTTNLIVSSLGGASTRCLQVGTDGTVSANASACGTGGGGTFAWTPTTNYGVTVNATSTPIWFQNGIMASTTAYLTYASSTALTVSGAAYFPGSGIWNSNGFVGIGTTSPYAALSVVGASGVVADKFYATSTTATSTFAGSLNVGNGAIVYDNTTGTTSINYLEAGSMSFAADSGVISWIDLPVTSASANGVANSYSANLNGNALLTIYGVSNGSGAVTNTAVGIGTTSPRWKLAVSGIGSFDDYVRASYFTATSTSVASTFPYASTTALTVSGTNGLQLATGLNGPLQANAGLVSATTSIGVLYGGTGLTSIASSSLLIGGPNNTFIGFATSSLGVALSDTTGTLAVSRGGTGLSSYTLGDVLYANGTGSLAGTSTANLKTTLALNNVENTALSTWAGSTNLTTLGTIGTGVWNGTTIAVANGGTGATTFGQGWIYSNGGTGALAASTSPTVNYLTATSTSIASTFPYASTTALTVSGTASTTNLIVSSLGGASTRCLQVGTDGTVSANASACGTGGGGGGIGWATTTASNESIYYYGTGNVAIGTSTPYSKLSVWGSGTGTNRLFELTNSASTTLASVLENGTAYFLGNLGIGTTSPNWKLSVAGIGSFDDYVRASYFTATSTTATSTFAGGVNAGAGNLLYDFTTGVTSASSFQTGNLNFDADAGMVSWTDLLLSSASSGTIEGYTASLNGSSTISVYGVSAGSGWLQPDWPRVAIGSSTPPSSKLTVFANGTGSGGTFEVVSSASTTQFKIFDNGITGVGTTSPFATFAVNPVAGVASNQFVVGSSTATNFIITNGGQVGVGTTTPWRTLSVTGTVAVNGLSTGVGGEYAVCIDNVTKELSSAGAQSCLVSSRRFKDDIAPLESGLDEVMKLKPSTFTLKNQAKTGSTTDTHLGFIAEEVDGVDKRLVQYEADGITPRTVRYEEVTALLAKAIQEQQLQIGGLASTTVDLAAKTSAASLSTVAAQANASLLTSNVDAQMSAQISGIDERVSDIEERISTLSASTTLIDALASSTADRLASSTTSAVLQSPSFLEKIFSAFMDSLASAVARIKSVFVGELHVEDKLCVDDVCINKDQLKALLVNAGGVSSTTPAVTVQSNVVPTTNTQASVPTVTPTVMPAIIQPSPAEPAPTPAMSATTTSATSTEVTATVTAPTPVTNTPEPTPVNQQSPELAQPSVPITETVEPVAPSAPAPSTAPSEPAATPEPAPVAPSAPSEPAPASDPAPAATQ